MDFLSEAFKGLQTLNEETFSFSADGFEDTEGTDLKDFLDNDEEIETVTIFDDEAEDEEDLKDSYIGKVILDCNVCHSLVYKDAKDVIIGEDGESANEEEECPFCFSTDGFKVIGQVKPFAEEEKGETEDEEETDTEDEIEVEEDEEEVKKESLKEGLRRHVRIRRPEIQEGCGVRRNVRNRRRKVNELFDVNAQGQTIGVGLGGGTGISIPGIGEDLDEEAPRARRARKACVGKDCEESVGLSVGGAMLAGAALGAGAGFLGSKLTDSVEECDGKVCRRRKKKTEDITESIENLSLETEDTKMEMTADPSGKITISTEPKKVEEEFSDETIGELDTDVEDEIIANSEEANEEEIPESPLEDENTEDEETTEDETSEDEVEVDEFDEETFESLGESYLKRVYSNVDSFKVSDVHESAAGRLFVEGLIKFNSGNVKKTNFVFKNCGVSKRGKTVFEGYNKEITRSNKSFTLKGRVDGKKIISESLAYRYNQNNKRINGIVK